MAKVLGEFRGTSGQIVLTESTITIKRKGLNALLYHGLKGDKEILIRDLSAVQFKKAGWTAGYIQFVFRGGKEGKGGLLEATQDENTVCFDSHGNAEFERLREWLQKKMTSVDSVPAVRPSAMDELAKLAELRKQGVVTEEEFQAHKARLLS